jgi:signal transduction histidine kinase/ActR/RegA family two-component response regulator
MPARSPLARYGVALIAIVCAVVLRIWFDPALAEGGFAFFFIAVIVAAWYGGLGPALLALTLTLLVSAWLFSAPPSAVPEPLPRVLIGLGVFFLMGIIIAVLSESMRKAQRRAEALAAEAIAQREQLRDVDRRKDEFLAVLSHELRNPLAPIRTALELMRLPKVEPASTEWARSMIERQVGQLVRLVDDLLDVSRIMRGKIELHIENVELRDIFSLAVETAKPVIDAKNHTLTVSLPSQPIRFVADAARLAQVIGNLLTNAAKYTEPGGNIALTGECDEVTGEVVIRVHDSGIGIAPDMLPRVFDLFTQASPGSSGTQGGLGIGLTLVKNLVELSGGRVEAHSDGPGKGSEFVVRMPLRRQEVSAAPLNGTESPTVIDEKKRRVLVVDDNKDAADTLARLLTMHGHEVAVCHDGPRAVEQAIEQRPDVVLLDLGMPVMDGLEVARRLRATPETSQVLLVAVTGWGQASDRRRTAEAGFDKHLVKPVDEATLCKLLADGAAATELPVPSQ